MKLTMPGPRAGLVLEDLPKRPAPEVDVKVVEILDIDAVAGGDGRPEEFLEDSGFLLVSSLPSPLNL